MLGAKARHGSQRTCPLCRDGLDLEAAQPCLGCDTRYHASCLGELGGCATLGCRLQGKLQSQHSHWRCRACHTTIEQSIARRRCPCGAYLHDHCVEDHSDACESAVTLRGLHRGYPNAHLLPRRSAPQPVRPLPSSPQQIESSRTPLEQSNAEPQIVLFLAWLTTLASAMAEFARGAEERGRAAEVAAGVICLLLALVSWWRGEFPVGERGLKRDEQPGSFWLGVALFVGLGLLALVDGLQLV